MNKGMKIVVKAVSLITIGINLFFALIVADLAAGFYKSDVDEEIIIYIFLCSLLSIALCSVVIGVGVFLLKERARRLFMGLQIMLFFILIYPAFLEALLFVNFKENYGRFGIIEILFYLRPLLIVLFYLTFFTSPKVKKQFRQEVIG